MGCLKLTYYNPTLRVLEKNIFLEKAPLEKKGLRVKKRRSSSTYGFNGMEKDDEVKGKGNSYDFGARMYDSRLGRWLSLDAKANDYPSHSDYVFSFNSPLMFKDADGNDGVVTIQKDPNGAGKIITISTTIYIKGGAGVPMESLIKSLQDFTSSMLPDTKLESGNTIKFDIKFESFDSKPDLDIYSSEEIGNNVLTIVEKMGGGGVSTSKSSIVDRGVKTTTYKTAKGGFSNPQVNIAVHEGLHFLGLVDRIGEKEFEGTIMDDASPNPISTITLEIIDELFSDYEEGTYLINEALEINKETGKDLKSADEVNEKSSSKLKSIE